MIEVFVNFYNLKLKCDQLEINNIVQHKHPERKIESYIVIQKIVTLENLEMSHITRFFQELTIT